MKQLSLSLIIIAVILLGACAPATKSELPIPSHFTTYTDEAGYFSISHPPNWKIAFSEIEQITQETEDYFKFIDSGGSLEEYLENVGLADALLEMKIVFFAGVPYESEYNPFLSVTFSPPGIAALFSPEGKWKLEDFVDAIVERALMKDAEEYHEFSRTKTTVDGKEAIILDHVAEYPFSPRTRSVSMFLPDNKYLVDWIVSAGVQLPEDFSDYEADLHAIVRSMRILK